MPSVPIWLSAAILTGTAVGVVVSHVEYVRGRTVWQGAVAVTVSVVAGGAVIAGADRWPAVVAIGFVLIPIATALAVGVFRAQRLRRHSQ